MPAAAAAWGIRHMFADPGPAAAAGTRSVLDGAGPARAGAIGLPGALSASDACCSFDSTGCCGVHVTVVEGCSDEDNGGMAVEKLPVEVVGGSFQVLVLLGDGVDEEGRGVDDGMRDVSGVMSVLVVRRPEVNGEGWN